MLHKATSGWLFCFPNPCAIKTWGMKQKLYSLLIFTAVLALGSVSCLTGIQAEPSPAIQSRYAYDQDWENIKEAILNKDVKGLSAYAASDAVDAQLIIDSFHADRDFLDQLKKASYKDLRTEDDGDRILLVFSAEVAGSDEEGNEYESGLYLYFNQGDPSLELVNFLAAG